MHQPNTAQRAIFQHFQRAQIQTTAVITIHARSQRPQLDTRPNRSFTFRIVICAKPLSQICRPQPKWRRTETICCKTRNKNTRALLYLLLLEELLQECKCVWIFHAPGGTKVQRVSGGGGRLHSTRFGISPEENYREISFVCTFESNFALSRTTHTLSLAERNLIFAATSIRRIKFYGIPLCWIEILSAALSFSEQHTAEASLCCCFKLFFSIPPPSRITRISLDVRSKLLSHRR